MSADRRLRRGIYLLPSLFTIGNILLGFLAVIRGMQGRFEDAAIAIFAAGVLDALDGRIARLTGTTSDFGREFDSLADVLTFCSAPAILAYVWGLGDLGRIGWLVPFFYLSCGATRLARFNVQTRATDPRAFVGLPTPAAAGTIASILLFAPSQEWKPWATVVLVVTLVCLGFLMVSTFRYASFKKIDLRARWSYRIVLPIAAIVLFVAYDPVAVLMTIAFVYTLSGPAAWAFGRLRTLGRTAPPETASPVERS